MRALLGRAGASPILLDVMDNIGLMDTASNTKGLRFFAGYSPVFVTAITDTLLNTISGLGTPGAAHVQVDGDRITRFQSGAVVNTYGRSASAAKFELTMGKDLAAAPSYGRLPTRYDFQSYVRRSAPLVGAVKFGTIYTFETGGPPGNFLVDGAGIQPGVEVISDPGINAGRWTLRVRPVSGGGITVSLDSGIAGTGDHVIGFRYDHNVTPRLAFLLDGAEVGSVSGLANVPRSQLTTEFERIAVLQRVPDIVSAGQLDFYFWSRYTTAKLPGWA